MQDKNVIKLTDQDAALLEQGASMLEGLENDERNRGNCSAAEGAGCSAHAVRRLVSALLAHDREIGQCLHQIQEPAAAEQAAWHAVLDEGRAQATGSVSNATSQPAPAAVTATASPTFMTADQGRDWAWNNVREYVGTEGWTVMDSVNFHDFFLYGWNYRGQYELQRTATRAAVMQEILSAAPAAVAPVVLPELAAPIIEKLLALSRIVDIAVEDWGESLADGSMDVKFHSDVVTELESILDHFDGLPEGPDDNVIESGPVKAARILRTLLATATGLPAQAVLDYPWRDRLLDGRELVRDQQGFAEHPELPLLDEGMKPRAFFAALGVEMKHTMADDDLSMDEYDAMSDAENWSAWMPRPPIGDAWNLVAIFDTEDGPAAWWARTQKESREAEPQVQAGGRDAESDYQRGYRHGYNRRDAEVQGALL